MQKHILSMYENSQIGTQQGLQADKHLLANQPDTVVVDKESKRTVVMDGKSLLSLITEKSCKHV